MNRDELSVYADQLQIEGDIRGEIIALELLPPRPDLEVRRDALMQKWLGFDPRGMAGVRFRFGFVELRSQQLETVLATPAAPFIRSLVVSGSNTEVVHALGMLARAPREHLTRLSIWTGRRFGERRARAPFIVEAALATELIRVTPQLSQLYVIGNRVLVDFPHPALQRVHVIAHDAIAALVDAGPTMPAVRELGFSFTQDPDGRVAFSEHGLPNTLLARSTLPALVDLDLSANELQRSWEDRHVALFELLSELGVLRQLRRLRVPAVHTDEERTALEHARAQMPPRALVETGNGLPAPLHDLLEPAISIAVRIENHAGEHRISMRQLGELMSARWSTFDEAARDAWFELWNVLTSIPTQPDDGWAYEPIPAEVHPRAIFEHAFASLGDRIDDNLAIAELAAIIARSREPRVLIRRYAW